MAFSFIILQSKLLIFTSSQDFMKVRHLKVSFLKSTTVARASWTHWAFKWSSVPWELGKSSSCSFWLELVLLGGLLKSHSHSAMRFRTASSSASMTKHFLAEGSVHLTLEWCSLQRKANSVLSLQPEQTLCGDKSALPAQPQGSWEEHWCNCRK